jgi:hypothetical protein
VREELRRLGIWFKYKIHQAKQQVMAAREAADASERRSVFLLGFANILQLNVRDLEAQQAKLPAVSRNATMEINPDLVTLGATPTIET